MSNHLDERTIATEQRWAARGMSMLYLALPIDLMVRGLVLKQEPQQYLDIWFVWVAIVCLRTIGTTASGVEPFGGKWSKAWLSILIMTVTSTVVLTLMGTVHTPAHLIAVIVGAAAGAAVFVSILRGIYSVWERVTLGRGSREE